MLKKHHSNYFEYQYIVTKTFFESIWDKKHTVRQAAEICMHKMQDYLDGGINTVIIYTIILEKVQRYGRKEDKNILQYYLKELEEVKEIISHLNVDDYLDTNEKEFLSDDIGWLEPYLPSLELREEEIEANLQSYASYFEYRYLVTEHFYELLLDENYTTGQAAGRCFCEILRDREIDTVIVYVAIIKLAIEHDKKELKYWLKDWEKAKEMMNHLNVDDFLNKKEKDSFLSDINYIKEAVNSLKNEKGGEGK